MTFTLCSRPNGRPIRLSAANIEPKRVLITGVAGGVGSVARRIYEQVASLASAGKLEVNIDKSFPLADASQAQAYSMAGHAEGKIILLVDAAQAERR